MPEDWWHILGTGVACHLVGQGQDGGGNIEKGQVIYPHELEIVSFLTLSDNIGFLPETCILFCSILRNK